MAPFTILSWPERKMSTDPQSVADIEHVKKHGYVLLPSILDPKLVQDALNEIDQMTSTAKEAMVGRNPFEGVNTNRIYSLLNKTRVFDDFTIIPRVLALNDYFLDPGYQITSFHTIQINPGEAGQELHHDDAFCHFPRPRQPLGTAIMVALDSFTAENGATSMIPGSHTWNAERTPKAEEAIPMECPAGSVLYFIGTTWHGAGANRSEKPRRSLTVQYCQPYIRPIENQILAVDPRRLPEIKKEIVEMMGYKIHKPFIGYADGLNPIRGARRMVEWLQKPLIERPPAFPDHGTGKAKL